MKADRRYTMQSPVKTNKTHKMLKAESMQVES